jgi:hypothetical protein
VVEGERFVTRVVEEECERELRRTTATISPFEARGTVVHQRETPLRRESPAFGEVQDDGSAVDAEADVFDGLVATIRTRCCLDSVRRGWSGIPIHGYIAGMVTPAALSGAK